MESWRDEKKEQDTYITVSSHLTKRCHIFATLKQTLLTVQIHSAAFQHRVTCQNPNYSVYTYIWTRFDNCALSLNSSGMFKRMVIAGLKQTENKSGSQNQLNRCRQPCREFWERGLVVGLFRCWAIIATICSAACFYPGPFSPRPPLLAALSVSAYHRDWRDMWSTMEKSGSGIHVALQSSGQKTITGWQTHLPVRAHVLTHIDTFKDPPQASFQSFQLHPKYYFKKNISVSHKNKMNCLCWDTTYN